MTRAQILSDSTIAPIGKLIIMALYERTDRVWNAKELAIVLGIGGFLLAEMASPLRARGFLDKEYSGRHLPLADLRLSDTARAAYAPLSREARTVQ